jgi:hypothetical protein
MPTCPACRAETSEGQRYCADCGLGLDPRPSPGRNALLAIAAVASVGLATIGLEALINRWFQRKGR